MPATDPRIPVILLDGPAGLDTALRAGPPAAVLLEAGAEAPAAAATVMRVGPDRTRHPLACTCCGGRSPTAAALDRLFQARVRGQAPWFDRVLAVLDSPPARAALGTALREDVMAAARFRLAE